jgi:hypothetical protein
VAKAAVAKAKSTVPAGMMKTGVAVKRTGLPRGAADGTRGDGHESEQEATREGTGHEKLRYQDDRSDT